MFEDLIDGEVLPIGGTRSQLITALIFALPRMTFNPHVAHLMRLSRLEQLLPKIDVFDRRLLGVFPSACDPRFDPMLVEGVDQLLGIGIEDY